MCLTNRVREQSARQMRAAHSDSLTDQAPPTWSHGRLPTPSLWADQPQASPLLAPSLLALPLQATTSPWISTHLTAWAGHPSLRPIAAYERRASPSPSRDTTCSSLLPPTLTSESRFGTGSTFLFHSVELQRPAGPGASEAWGPRRSRERGPRRPAVGRGGCDPRASGV